MEKIWAVRNGKIHGETMLAVEIIKRNTDSLVEEHWVAQTKKFKMKKDRANWIPPPQGWLKMNVDAAVRIPTSVGACVLRNVSGEVVFVATWSNPTIAEAEAILQSILEAKKLGVEKFIFEGDALLTMAPLKDGNLTPDWSISAVIEKARHQLGNAKFFWSRAKIPREATVLNIIDLILSLSLFL